MLCEADVVDGDDEELGTGAVVLTVLVVLVWEEEPNVICSTHSDSSVSIAGAHAVNVISRAHNTPNVIHCFIIRHILSAFYCTINF